MKLTVDEALAFLNDHQPMPSDREGSNDLFVRYDQIRRFFQANPDVRCLPLFLGSFGDGDGRGNYQLVEDVFRQFPPGDVIPCLQETLQNGTSVSRYWAAQIASLFPATTLVGSLAECLQDPDDDVRYMAVVCLEQISDQKSKDVLHHQRRVESSQEVLELLDEVLGDTSR